MTENILKFQTMPLRFRVWDMVGQQFLQRRLPDGVSIEYPIFELPLEIDCLDEDEKANFIISQDTGLKDKNGESIFTGDIVREESIYKGKYIIGTIEYRNGRVFYTKELCADFPPSGVEVIGNIWQNPELMGVG